jgi:hypothetical protein
MYQHARLVGWDRVLLTFCSGWLWNVILLISTSSVAGIISMYHHVWPCFMGFFFFKSVSCYIAQVGLKLVIFLPQPPECWDYRHEPLVKVKGNLKKFWLPSKLFSCFRSFTIICIYMHFYFSCLGFEVPFESKFQYLIGFGKFLAIFFSYISSASFRSLFLQALPIGHLTVLCLLLFPLWYHLFICLGFIIDIFVLSQIPTQVILSLALSNSVNPSICFCSVL